MDSASPCVDDMHPDNCEMAVDLGELAEGGETEATGFLPMLTDEDWFLVAFPSREPSFADAGVPDAGTGDGGGVGDAGLPLNLAGGGAPNIELVADDATMVIEVRLRCGAALACGDSTARELTSWSFVDDASEEAGSGAYSTRDVAWPESVYVKVSRRGGPVTCEGYTLRITR